MLWTYLSPFLLLSWSVSMETSMDVDVWEKSETEVDMYVVADFDSLQNDLERMLFLLNP